MTVVLGISNSHNGSVALICDGEVKVAIQAERISRKKRQSLSLSNDIELAKTCVSYCLTESGVKYEDINAVALTTPWPARKINDTELFEYIGGIPKNYFKTFFVSHHYAHMEYILHYGNFGPGIVLIMDGSGSLESDRKLFNIKEEQHSKAVNYIEFSGKEVISAYWFNGVKSFLIYRFCPSQGPLESYNRDAKLFLQSIGHYWEWASYYCFGSGNEAGKLMGLAAFGEVEEVGRDPILDLSDKGKLKLNFSELKRTYTQPNFFNLDLSTSKHHQCLARRVQDETEMVILKLLKFLKAHHPAKRLYLSGGVALNVVANERIKSSNIFEELILNGSVEDNGTAIGAALAASIEIRHQRTCSAVTDYYGKHYSNNEIRKAVNSFRFPSKTLAGNELFKTAAELICREYILGWFQGRSEFGPRALGNRSILANPLSFSTKYVLDNLMKCRDRYRPYAPVVIEDRAYKYFAFDGSSPAMMRNVRVLDKRLLAVTHIDGTARVQTVNREQNEVLYSLLLAVEEEIGVPILLNTSFNRPGEPIVESPFDAIDSFSKGSLDYLILGNLLISRT